jgi:hypothetical protein
MKTGVLIAIILACSSWAYGQDDGTVGPDRPSFSSSTHTVPAGHVQLEGGTSRTIFGNTSGYDVGELLMRVGLSSRIEVRANFPSYVVSRTAGVRISGSDDSSIEGKFLLKSGDRGALAVLTTAILATGSRSVAEHKFQPGVTLISDVSVTKKIVVTTNGGYYRASEAGQRYNFTFGVSTVNFALTRNLSVFTEFYALNHQHGWLRRYAATGISWTVKKKTAFDLGGGVGLGNHAHGPDHYLEIGISRLF